MWWTFFQLLILERNSATYIIAVCGKVFSFWLPYHGLNLPLAFFFIFLISHMVHFYSVTKIFSKKLFLVTRGRQRIIETRESYFLLLFGSKVQPFPSHRSFFVSIHSSSSICNIQMHENIYICRQRLTFPSYTEPYFFAGHCKMRGSVPSGNGLKNS